MARKKFQRIISSRSNITKSAATTHCLNEEEVLMKINSNANFKTKHILFNKSYSIV